MSMKKATWQKPELIVLARLRPEEQVLALCKKGVRNARGQGTTHNQADCFLSGGTCPICSGGGLS